MASVSVFHATVYAFTQEGVKEITKLFDTEVVDVNVRCSYYPETHMFRVQCPVDFVDTIYSKFASICGNYIKEHCEPNTKFTRMRGSQPDADADLDFELLMAEDGEGSGTGQIPTPQDDSDDEDNPIWRPKDSRTDVTKIFPARMLDSIAQDVACVLSLSVERACVVIQDASSDVVQLISQRLDNIERNAYRMKITSHLVRPEKDRGVNMVLRTLVDIPDDMLLHTLAPEELAGRLPLMRRVRMMRLNKEIVSTTAPVAMLNQDLLAAWNSLKHSQLAGFESTAHRLEFVETDGSLCQRSIGLWASKVEPDLLADDAPLDSFEPLVPEAAWSLNVADDHPDLGFPDSDHGGSEPVPDVETNSPAWPNIYAKGTTDVGDLLDLQDESEVTDTAPQTDGPRGTPTAPHRRVDAYSLSRPKARFQTAQTENTSSRSPESEIVERIQMDKDSDAAIRKLNPSTHHRKPNGKGKAAVSVAAANLELPEWLPARLAGNRGHGSENSSPRPVESKPQGPESNTLELPEISKDLMEILDHARSFRGKLEVEVQIGRVLLSGFRVDQAKDFTTSVVDPGRMASGLRRHTDAGNVWDHFTRRLTTSVQEACLVAVPHLFEQEPLASTFWFEFHCEDNQHNQIAVKVPGDGSDAKAVRSAETVGQVLLHFPKRKWDARLVVKGQEQYPIKKEVSHLVDSVSTLFRDSSGGGGPEDLHRIIDMRFRNTKELRVVQVFAKRRVSHKCKVNHSVTLCVTEVQHLNFDGLIKHVVDTALWGVKSNTRACMIDHQALWFEAKLVVSAHPSFEQNLALGLGDDAEWKAEDVMGAELLCDIQTVVDQMVTRLDGVGATNKGPRGSREDLEEIEAERVRRELEKLR